MNESQVNERTSNLSNLLSISAFFKQLLDEIFVISRIIKVEGGSGYQPKPKAEADNPYRDLDYSGYHKNRI